VIEECGNRQKLHLRGLVITATTTNLINGL